MSIQELIPLMGSHRNVVKLGGSLGHSELGTNAPSKKKKGAKKVEKM
jgi:hypothetical protein